MLQTATVNPTIMMPSALAGLHPSNVNNVDGRVVRRSPNGHTGIQMNPQ